MGVARVLDCQSFLVASIASITKISGLDVSWISRKNNPRFGAESPLLNKMYTRQTNAQPCKQKKSSYRFETVLLSFGKIEKPDVKHLHGC